MGIESTLPEVGQLVEVRQRRFVVSDVTASTLEPSLLLTGIQPVRHHVIGLRAVDDETLGEDVRVVWEIEPNKRVIERATLPTPAGFDPPQRLDAFLNAVRWGATASADVQALQSPFRSGIDMESYQLDPVARALQLPRVNLLIADDVGLGKTIEAGLVAQELLIRHRARRILIVCPAGLQLQWRDQMRDKFGLEFRIIDSEALRTLRRKRGLHVNPWAHFPRLITSMDYLKREQPFRLFREILPTDGPTYPRKFDLLIVDEAHNIAPAGRGNYAVDSQRTHMIREIAPHFEHRLFLSATPHNGYAESFSALLELLDNQRFARGIPPHREKLALVMIRRLKSDIISGTGARQFPERRLDALEVPYSDAERQAHQWLEAYSRLRLRHAGSGTTRTATEFVLKLLKKRLFSSPAAFRDTLIKHRTTLAEAPTVKRRSVAESAGILHRMIAEAEEDVADDDEGEADTLHTVAELTLLFTPVTAEEEGLLQQMSRWAESAALRPDSKATRLLEWLGTIVRPGGQWNDERVIVFTEYRATQKWLETLFATHGFTGNGRVQLLYGGMAEDKREQVKAAFQATPSDSPVRILLATDAASEGIDLQRYCHRLVHYEIPWNPNRMEQRNGRIDRHGQHYSPHLLHFAPRGYNQEAITGQPVGALEGDLEFLARVVKKVEQIREDLGKVGPVIADQVADAMLGNRKTLDTAAAEQDAGKARSLLRIEGDFRARLLRLQQKLSESAEALNLSAATIADVATIGLELAGQPPLRPTTLVGIWETPTVEHPLSPLFMLPPLTGSWARALDGNAHPFTHKPRPITFDADVAKGQDGVVLVHLNHPLVQLAMQVLRAEVWNPAQSRGLYRVSTRLLPKQQFQFPVVVAHARLVLTGADHHRLHEELMVAGGELEMRSPTTGFFRRLRVQRLQEIMSKARATEASSADKAQFQAVWESIIQQPLLASLDKRQAERTESLLRILEERKVKEQADITEVLMELQKTLQAEIADADAPTQLRLLGLEKFSTDERDQYTRNVEALRRRLAQIPQEREAEVAHIETRYENITARLFPIAVTFYVPG